MTFLQRVTQARDLLGVETSYARGK